MATDGLTMATDSLLLTIPIILWVRSSATVYAQGESITFLRPCVKSTVYQGEVYCPMWRKLCFTCSNSSCPGNQLRLLWPGKSSCNETVIKNNSVTDCFQLPELDPHIYSYMRLTCKCLIGERKNDSCGPKLPDSTIIGGIDIGKGYIPSTRTMEGCVVRNWDLWVCEWSEAQSINHRFLMNVTVWYRENNGSEVRALCTVEEGINSCSMRSQNSSWDVDTEYSVWVTASNKFGSFPSEPLHFIGKDIVKPNSVMFNVTAASTLLILEWASPRPGNNLMYQFNITDAYLNKTQTIYFVGNESRYSFPLENLTPYCNYTITARCKPERSGLWSNIQQQRITTLEAVPGAVPVIPEGAFKSVDMGRGFRNITLYWQDIPVQMHHGILQHLLLRYKPMEKGMWKETKIPSHDHSAVLQLSSSEKYIVQLNVYNTMGYNQSLHLQNFIIPKQEHVFSLDVHFDVVVLQRNKIKVYLKGKPQRKGVIRIFWCLHTERKAPCQHGLQFIDAAAEERNKLINLKEDVNKYSFGVSLTGHQSSGVMWSHCRYHANNSIKAPELSQERTTGSSVTLRIKEPQCSTNREGYITSYLLRYHTGEEKIDGTEITVQRESPSQLYTIEGLSPRREYKIIAYSQGERRSQKSQSASEPLFVSTTGIPTEYVIIIGLFGPVLIILLLVGSFFVTKKLRNYLKKMLTLPASDHRNIPFPEVTTTHEDYSERMYYYNPGLHEEQVMSNGSVPVTAMHTETHQDRSFDEEVENNHYPAQVCESIPATAPPVVDQEANSAQMSSNQIEEKRLPTNKQASADSGSYAGAGICGDPELTFDPYTAAPIRTDIAFTIEEDSGESDSRSDSDSNTKQRNQDSTPLATPGVEVEDYTCSTKMPPALSKLPQRLTEYGSIEINDYGPPREFDISDYSAKQGDCPSDKSDNQEGQTHTTKDTEISSGPTFCAKDEAIIPLVGLPCKPQVLHIEQPLSSRESKYFLHDSESSSGSAVSITDAFSDSPNHKGPSKSNCVISGTRGRTDQLNVPVMTSDHKNHAGTWSEENPVCSNVNHNPKACCEDVTHLTKTGGLSNSAATCIMEKNNNHIHQDLFNGNIKYPDGSEKQTLPQQSCVDQIQTTQYHPCSIIRQEGSAEIDKAIEESGCQSNNGAVPMETTWLLCESDTNPARLHIDYRGGAKDLTRDLSSYHDETFDPYVGTSKLTAHVPPLLKSDSVQTDLAFTNPHSDKDQYTVAMVTSL